MNLNDTLDILAREPAADFDLAEVLLHLARDEFPTLDVEAHLAELEGMAHEVKGYLNGRFPDQIHGLCRYLFHEMGFRGNQREYYDPRNSYLHLVMERRVGIPISLAAVTIAVGRRAGLNLVGVGLPGHFIVKAIGRNQEILVDPFHGGRILSRADCEILVQQATGLAWEISDLAIQPLPLGLTVQRMLNNLKAVYLSGEDWPRAGRVLARLLQLAPHEAALHRDLGLCLLQQHLPGRALSHFKRYTQKAPEATDLGQIQEWTLLAEKTLAAWN
jgi:regulator of sirC expression with transglutaminase-like and TPR domain